MQTTEFLSNGRQGAGEPDFLLELNEQQRQAVTHTNGPLLIVAGAGSGKTRVLTYRIAYLLQKEKVLPSNILALTFTNKAAKEMKMRIRDLIGKLSGGLWMGTFHSVFAKILRFEAEKIGFDTDFSIYDSSDSEQVIKLILTELGHSTKDINPRLIQRKISDAKNQLISADTYQEKFIQSTLDDITGNVYRIYTNRLKYANSMDFDDLLIRPIELFNTHPDVLEKYQQKFRYILIDEYQDTNHAQYTVTRQLSGAHNNICVVGDDAQSIYSFRGADISNILNFKSDYNKAAQVPLEQNYRSTKYILQCADSIIKKNSKQLEKTLWTENDEGNAITLLENYDERDEANRVVNYIQSLNLRQGYDYNNVAILYRTNYQSRVFEEALRRKNIPYQLVGGLSFYQRKEIKDVVAYLTLLVNPMDEQNLLRVINEPSRGIGQKSLTDLLKIARRESQTLWEVITSKEFLDESGIYKPAKAKIIEFVDMINELKAEMGGETSLYELSKQLVDKSGYIAALIEDGSVQALSRRDNVIELQNAISWYEKSTKTPSLSAFLQEISLITDADKYDEEKPAVTLMTVHGSKGLEFPVIFIVGLEENLFPMGGRNGEEADIEEERRLFYVAITRAEKELFFSFCKIRFKYGEETRQLRSRFLNEVDPGVVRTETGATIRQTGSDSTATAQMEPPEEAGYNWKHSLPGRKKPAGNSSAHIEYDYDGDPFQTGTDVHHEKFGAGKIVNRTREGKDSRVVVFFKNRGQKTLLLRAANLKVLN